MIELFTGTPGSGKSLHLAKIMKNWMSKKKAPVIGNFDFNSKACNPKGYGGYLLVNNKQLTPDFLIRFSDYYKSVRKWQRVPEEHILLVIDECYLLFNARDWSRGDRSGWISFFTQHRKLGYHIILVAQFDNMIDKQIRSLFEYEMIHRKVKNIGFMGRLLNSVALGGLHVCIKIYYPLNEKVGSEFFKADKTLFALYDSYTRFDGT